MGWGDVVCVYRDSLLLPSNLGFIGLGWTANNLETICKQITVVSTAYSTRN